MTTAPYAITDIPEGGVPQNFTTDDLLPYDEQRDATSPRIIWRYGQDAIVRIDGPSTEAIRGSVDIRSHEWVGFGPSVGYWQRLSPQDVLNQLASEA